MTGHKLNIGDVILIQGFVMLKGLDGGQHYKVICFHSTAAAYILRRCNKNGVTYKAEGNRKAFLFSQIDLWINTENDNRIDIIKREVTFQWK